MSATQEILAESIRTLDDEIKLAVENGQDRTAIDALYTRRQELVAKLNAANQSLNESSELLKG